MANALVFLPFISWFERLVVKTVREKPGAIQVAPQYLEEHLLETPPLAFEQAIREVLRMIEMARLAAALRDRDIDMAKRALKREDTLNNLYVKFRQNHVRRLDEGKCQLLSGLVFLDFVQNLEKIGDHMTNIAQSVLGGLRWNGEA